ncbi:MAG: hypothetical protein VKJ06_07310 [Vampirovibrionales bacterium]|nr:hypothetical protein [Vampirovibrionales bacterium]
MSLTEAFNPDVITEQVLASISDQLNARGYSEELLAENQGVLFEFSKIVCNLMIQEPDLELSGSDVKVPFTDAMAQQVVLLFVDGVEHALFKCFEYRLEGQIKLQLLQQLAQQVYSHTKQLVASTVGQESTPEVQFGPEQLKDFVRQTAESTLAYYMSEYEKSVGPLHPEEAGGLPMQMISDEAETPDALTMSESMLAQPELPEAPNLPEPPEVLSAPRVEPSVPMPPAQPVAPALPYAGYEKSAALALLVSVMPPAMSQGLMGQLDPETQTQVQQMAQSPIDYVKQMDVRAVTQHLQALIKQLAKTLKQAKRKEQPPMRHLIVLARKTPQAKLLATVQKERPWVQWMVRQAVNASASQRVDIQAERLSVKTQQVLLQFVQSQL